MKSTLLGVFTLFQPLKCYVLQNCARFVANNALPTFNRNIYVHRVYSNYFVGNEGSFLAKGEWDDELHCIGWGKSIKIQIYIGMLVPTLPITSVDVTDLNRSWYLHIQLLSFYQVAVIAVLFQPCKVWPRLSSWSDPFWLPSMTRFVGGHREPSLLKTSPRIHLKVAGGSRGTRAEVLQTKPWADIYYTSSSLHPSMCSIFCQH